MNIGKMTTCMLRQVDEKHISTKAQSLLWSPMMDLIAVSNVKGEVVLHRLNWQKVWTLAAPKEGSVVRAIAWRPDGKVLAVGYADGSTVLVDVENSEQLHSHELSCAVTSLTWTEGSKTVDEEPQLYKDVSASYLPKLPSLSKNYGSVSKQADENPEDPKKLQDQETLNFLTVGTFSGQVHMFAFGIFPCGSIELKKHVSTGGKTMSVVNAFVSENMRLLTVFFSLHDEEQPIIKQNQSVEMTANFLECDEKMDTSESKDEEDICSRKMPVDEQLEVCGTLEMIHFDVSIFADKSTEIKLLALKYGHISGLMEYLASTIRCVTEAWENILLELDSKLSVFAKSIPDSTVSVDLLHVLIFGIPSPELEHFLLIDITEKGLKKLGHSIDMSYANIQKLLLKHLHMVGQSLLFHLFELQGIARWERKMGLFYPEEDTLMKSVVQEAGSFILKSVELQQVIMNSVHNYKAFFRWLFLLILRMNDEAVPPEITKRSQQDVGFIANFLSDYLGRYDNINSDEPVYLLEKVGQYLQDSDLEDMVDNDSCWTEFVKEHPELIEKGLVFPHYRNKSLVQQHNQLVKLVNSALNAPSQNIKSTFAEREPVISVLGSTRPHKLRFTHTNENDRVTVALTTKPAENKKVFALDYSCKAGEPIVSKCGFRCVEGIFSNFTQPGDVYLIPDLMFYNSDILSVLLMEDVEYGSPTMLQLPVTNMMEKMKDVSVTTGQPLLDANSNAVNLSLVVEASSYKHLEGIVASGFAVSGSRKVAAILFLNRRRVRIYEMESAEEEDESALDSLNVSNEQDTSAA